MEQVTADEPASELERQTMRRVAWRLLPLLMLGYFCAFLDRVNVGFAGLTMNKELGLSPAAFGFGAGCFFVGYFLFEVPSNLLLTRIGARRWMARILVTWGVVSALNAFVWNAPSFYAARFALGVAEAGFYPGAVLYFTWWFPSVYRSRVMAGFQSSSKIALILGPIASGQLLQLDGWLGLAGWKWLFLVEATPPILVAVLFVFFLSDRPQDARWLRPEQRAWLITRIDSETTQRRAITSLGITEVLRNRRVWLLTLVWFGICVSGYGVNTFAPRIIKSFGVGYGTTGVLAAVPYVFAMLAMNLGGWHSDRSGERTWHVAGACLVCAAGLATASLLAGSPVLLMAALTVAVMAQASIEPIFWSLPTAMLTGIAAAGGIAFINSVGNLGGFVGPSAFGLVSQATGSGTAGLAVLALPLVVGACIIVAIGHDRRLERFPRAAAGTRAENAPAPSA
jgi:MFS transporter, ACS family, tartrate transporter